LLGQRSVIIQAYNTNYDQILPANINLQNDNVAIITFPSPISGYAVATRGGRSITNFIPQTGSSYPITSSWAINATNLRGGQITSSGALINGNLKVNGTAIFFSASYIYVTSSQFIIGDNIITLNANSPYKRFAGIEMNDSGSSAKSSLLWDSLGNYFFVSGSTTTNSQNKLIVGPNNNVDLTTYYVPIATAGNKLGNSVIYNSGSNVGIGTTSLSAIFVVSGSSATSIIDGVRIGRGAGNIITNTVVGNRAFTNNTSGYNNNAFGYRALSSNTTGRNNNAFGVGSLNNNTTGRYNSAFDW